MIFRNSFRFTSPWYLFFSPIVFGCIFHAFISQMAMNTFPCTYIFILSSITDVIFFYRTYLWVTLRVSLKKQEQITFEGIWFHFRFLWGLSWSSFKFSVLWLVVLFVFVLCLMPDVAYFSGLSILDCPFCFLQHLFIVYVCICLYAL